MRIFLRWLVDNSWVLYVICAIGALVYLIRTLGAARERRLAIFTLERETATSRMTQSLTAMFVFVALGLLIFFSTTQLLPQTPMFRSQAPEPTATPVAGLEPTPTPTITVAPTPTLAAEVILPTFTPLPTPIRETPAIPPTETAIPEPTVEEVTPPPETSTPAALSGPLSVRFGNFALLVGYSVSARDLRAREPLTLILYWQALDEPAPLNYVVFTHLLAQDGHLIAQHDGIPVGGSRPFTTWSPGEGITDIHSMAFVDPTYTGPATLRVGLYDPASGERVLTDSGADAVSLPVTLNILP